MNKYQEFLTKPETSEATARGDQAIRTIQALDRASKDVSAALTSFNRLLKSKRPVQGDELDNAIEDLGEKHDEIAEQIRNAATPAFLKVVDAWKAAQETVRDACREHIIEAASSVAASEALNKASEDGGFMQALARLGQTARSGYQSVVDTVTQPKAPADKG